MLSIPFKTEPNFQKLKRLFFKEQTIFFKEKMFVLNFGF